MDPFKIMMCLLILACLLCSMDALGFQAQNQEARGTFQSSSSSRTFGLKTTSKHTASSSSGTFTNNLQPSEVQESKENPSPESSQTISEEEGEKLRRKDNFGSIAQSREEDDTIYGLLPAEEIPKKPVNFGTRIQNRNNQPDCSANENCPSPFQSSVEQFEGSNSGNQQTQQGHSIQENIDQNDDQSVHSFVERRENVDNIQQQYQEDQFSDEGQNQSGISQNDFTDNDQIEPEFRNFGNEEVNNNQIPVIDSNNSEQADNQEGNIEENESSFQNNQGRIETPQDSQGDIEARQNPSNFDYVDQQSYLDGAVDQFPDAFEPENISFQKDTEVENRNSQFDQGGFQQPSIIPPSVVSNEFSNDFNDNGENLFFEEDPIQALKYNVPGNPGEDYPIFYQVPETSFDCNQQQFAAGIFGDVDAQCQVFHFCKESGGRDSFLCPNGTVFNQQYFVCDWWYNYNCADTPGFYNLNAQLYWDFDTISPSQILSGTGIGSQEDGTFDQGDNIGGVAIQGPSIVNSDSQNQVPFTDTQPISNIQQSFNTRSSFQEDVKHTSMGFSEHRNDASVQDKSRSTSSIQSNFAHSEGFSFQENIAARGDSSNNPDVQESIDFPNNPSEISDNSNVDDFSQTKIDSDNEFRQIIDERAPIPKNVEEIQIYDGQVSENEESNVDQDSFTNDEFESSDHAISSDPGRNSQQEAGVETQFSDQNGFEQQKLEDDQQPQPNGETFVDETNGENLNQDKLDEISTGFINVDNQNIPQDEVFQQGVEIPLDGGNARSDEGNDSVKDSSESFSNEATYVQNQENLEQQNIDPVIINNEQGTVKELTENVFDLQGNQNIQSNGNVEDSGTSEDEEKIAGINQNNNFGQRDQIDVSNINQETVNIDDILDGFQDRDNAFKDSNFGFQANNNDKTIDINRSPFVSGSVSQTSNQENTNLSQRPLEDIPLTQNQNNDAMNKNLDPNPEGDLQQQKLQEDNIYNMMRGYPNNALVEQNRNRPNQQRVTFRPQNTSPTLNSNFEINNQNSGRVLGSQNVDISQKKLQEQIIFPNEREQRNGENQWWKPSQQGTNPDSRKLPKQPPRNFNTQSQEQSNTNFNVPSNKNWNVPTNGHQIRTPELVRGAQNNPNGNRNVIENGHQTNEQYFRNQNEAPFGNTHQNIQTGPISNFRSLSNEDSGRFQGVKGVLSPVQARFNQVQFNEGNLPNKNTQPIAQLIRNQQLQPDSNLGQQARINVQNQNAAQLNPVGRPGSISRVKGRFSEGRSQFQNIRFNSATIPNQINLQSVPANNQEQFRQGQFTNTIQSNSKNNNQQQIPQHHNEAHFNREQFQNIDLNSANIPKQRNLQTVPANNQEQPRQDQFQNTIQSNSGTIPNNNQQHISQEHNEERSIQGQFQNNIQVNSRNVPIGNNQRIFQRNRQEQPRQDQFQNPNQFNSENIPNDNQKQIVQQQSQANEQDQFQNSIGQNGNNHQFVQQNIPEHEQSQFHNIHFHSGNIPSGNSQLFVQQNVPEQRQFQNTIPFNSGEVPNGNSQQLAQQNIQIHQEQFSHEQHFRFEKQAEKDNSFIQNVPQENSRDGRFSRHTRGDFVQSQLNADPINRVERDNQFFASESGRGARSNFNIPNPLGQILPQKIATNDAIVYSQNDPPVAESSISYNGWRPIVRY